MNLEGRRASIGFAAGAVLAFFAGYMLGKHTGTTGPCEQKGFVVDVDRVKVQPPNRRHFEIATVELGPPLPAPPVTARVSTIEKNTAPGFAPLDGRVERVAISLGDKVKQGDRLVLVRSGDLATMLRELRADRLSVQTKRALVQKMEVLVEARASSENELLVAKHELEEADLSAKAADARLRSLAVAEDGDNQYWLLATRAGTVVHLDAAPGQEVGPNKDKPVVTVAALDDVLVLADMPQRDALSVSTGTIANIELSEHAEETLAGTVENVSSVVDPERQTVTVRIVAHNTGAKLRPNSFVEVTFRPDAKKKVLHVPSEAVLTDGSRAVVFVEGEAGTYRRHAVAAGRTANGLTEIGSGLEPGDRVVTRGALLLLNAVDPD